MPIEPSEGVTQSDQEKIRLTVGSIYMEGLGAGATQTARTYGVEQAARAIEAQAVKLLRGRLALVDKAIKAYRKMVKAKIKQLQAQKKTEAEIRAAIYEYVRNLADNKAQIIAEMESAQGRLDGAGRIMDETDTPHEWRFSHFNLGASHTECALCKAIVKGNPYSQREAEKAGFPAYPHPGCDHGWVLVPLGEISYTEANPAGPPAKLAGAGLKKQGAPQKFATADEAIGWYNAWLKTLKAPDDPKSCPECQPRFGGWDPVQRWDTKEGKPIYWYIVGTSDQPSLVVEGEDTIREWGNQYYRFYAAHHSQAEADAITPQSEVPKKPVPQLKPSTPESEYWYDRLPDHPEKEQDHAA